MGLEQHRRVVDDDVDTAKAFIDTTTGIQIATEVGVSPATVSVVAAAPLATSVEALVSSSATPLPYPYFHQRGFTERNPAPV